MMFLDKYPRWEPGGLHHPFLLQWMFVHAEATGQKERDHAICQDHWQPSPKWDLSAEVPTIEVMDFKTTQEEIQIEYNEV